MNRIVSSRLAASWPCFLLIAMVLGCGNSGPQLAPVSGRVTLDGQPLADADVAFNVEGKSPGVGRTDADGYYELMYKRGVMGGPVGENLVMITVSSEVVRNPPPIPPRYNSESELRVEVAPRKQNVFDFDLTSAGN